MLVNGVFSRVLNVQKYCLWPLSTMDDHKWFADAGFSASNSQYADQNRATNGYTNGNNGIYV